MLDNRERLKLLEKREKRAAERLMNLEALHSGESSKLQADCLQLLEKAQEELAAAETLLLLEQERQAALAVILSAFPGTTQTNAETHAQKPLLLTRSADKF
jgi:hypothetical protein